MVERFADAALRHLETAEVLEVEGRIDDAAYHYGLVGEMALKAAIANAIGLPLPRSLRRHINDARQSLQIAISTNAQLLSTMRSGRLGGALGAELSQNLLGLRFVDWSLDIRYSDDTCCPVNSTNLVIWKADALELYNNGVF